MTYAWFDVSRSSIRFITFSSVARYIEPRICHYGLRQTDIYMELRYSFKGRMIRDFFVAPSCCNVLVRACVYWRHIYDKWVQCSYSGCSLSYRGWRVTDAHYHIALWRHYCYAQASSDLGWRDLGNATLTDRPPPLRHIHAKNTIQKSSGYNRDSAEKNRHPTFWSTRKCNMSGW